MLSIVWKKEKNRAEIETQTKLSQWKVFNTQNGEIDKGVPCKVL